MQKKNFLHQILYILKILTMHVVCLCLTFCELNFCKKYIQAEACTNIWGFEYTCIVFDANKLMARSG